MNFKEKRRLYVIKTLYDMMWDLYFMCYMTKKDFDKKSKSIVKKLMKYGETEEDINKWKQFASEKIKDKSKR